MRKYLSVPRRISKISGENILFSVLVFLYFLASVSIIIMGAENHYYPADVTLVLVGAFLFFMLLKKIGEMQNLIREKDDSVCVLNERMTAIEMDGDGIAITDKTGKITYANHAMVEMFSGWQSSPVIGRMITDFLNIDPSIRYKNNEADNNKAEKWNINLTCVNDSGMDFLASVSISVLPDGRRVFVICNRSEQTKYEKLLQQRLAAIEAAGDGIGIVNSEGNLIYMNRSMKMLHEIAPGDERGYLDLPWTRLYTEKGQEIIRNTVLPALEKEGCWKGESPILTKSGRVVFAEMSLTRLEDGGMIGTARDISDRVFATRERENLEKQLYQAQKMEAVGRLAGGIAHDFNNILAAIMGYAKFLSEDLGEKPESQMHAFSILSAVSQAKDVVNRLLVFSRKQDHSIKTFELTDSIRDSLDLIRPNIPASISIGWYCGSNPVFVMGDASMISQVIVNLFLNARDAIGNRSGEIIIKLFTRIWMPDMSGKIANFTDGLVPGQEYAVISVHDDGCGMDDEILEHIFDPFFTTKPAHQGTGLGLSMVHGAILSHHGGIEVITEPGKGTEFLLYLPMAVQDKTTLAGVQEPQPEVQNYPGLRIMLVDDQNDVREMMKIMLSRMDYDVESAPNAISALDMLDQEGGDVDLLLTDQSMPGMTGAELAERVSKKYPDIPIILMSGYSPESLEDILKNHACIKTVIRKPVDPDNISLAISQALADQREAAE